MSAKYYIVVTPFFPTVESFRGPYVYDQVRAIIRNCDYSVVVFHPTQFGDKREKYDYGGISVNLFPIRQTPSNMFTGLFDRKNSRNFLNAVNRLNIKADDIVAVHCHTMPFGCYGLALKKQNPEIKVMIQHHSRDPYSILYGKFAGWYPNLKYRITHSMRIAEQADIHISVSKVIEENLLKFPSVGQNEDYKPYLERIKPLADMQAAMIAKSVVLYNGVDTTKFFRVENDVCDLNLDRLTIGCIANFQKLKDQISLIKAVGILKNSGFKDISLILIGSGPELNNCKEYVEQYGLQSQIIFRKEVDHSKLNEFYNSIDLFILPSVYEGFGCVYTEAYAAGVPFMVCEGQGASEYIRREEREHWILQKNNPQDIANKIERYARLKPTQNLLHEYDINELIREFLKSCELI